jgi:membrane peptidoglycan carboxypeptidase
VALLRVEDSDGNVLYQYETPAEERIVAEEYTYLVSHTLSSPGNTCIVYSSCDALALPNGYPSAAKTGTSEPYENQRAVGDTWTVGYTPELVAGIWSGNSDNAPISRNMNSTLVALNSWKAFMVAAIEYLDLPPTPFERPDGVAEHRVDRTPSLYAQEVAHLYDRRRALSEREVAAREEAPSEPAAAAASVPDQGTGGPVQALIASPASGSVVSGQMTLAGTAAGAQMTGYRLLIGAGENPTEWYPFHQSSTQVQGGSLGTWDVSSLPTGPYTIVLVVSQAGGPDVSHAVRINVSP